MANIPFTAGRTWAERVLEADEIWAQVKDALTRRGLELPRTPRIPDLRLIVDNKSGHLIEFLNPGDHSANKQEQIPPSGENTAAMIMLAGDTLEEQLRHTEKLVEGYDLGNLGLSDQFMEALRSGKLSGQIREAYGPAPFAAQSKKLVPLAWKKADGSTLTIQPFFAEAAAYGTRNPDQEIVFHNDVAIFVQGTTTTAERIPSQGMCIAVSTNWQTQKEKTRPIVPEIAKEFYGQHFNTIPHVTISPEGYVESIDLKNGVPIITLDRPAYYDSAPSEAAGTPEPEAFN